MLYLGSCLNCRHPWGHIRATCTSPFGEAYLWAEFLYRLSSPMHCVSMFIPFIPFKDYEPNCDNENCSWGCSMYTWWCGGTRFWASRLGSAGYASNYFRSGKTKGDQAREVVLGELRVQNMAHFSIIRKLLRATS